MAPCLFNMNKTADQIYLERLSKSFQRIFTIFNKRKPGSTYSQAEIRALLNFNIEVPTGLSGFVKSLHKEAKLIPEVLKGERRAGLFYLQMLNSLTLRLLHFAKKGNVNKLKYISRELNEHDVMKMERKSLDKRKDKVFEGMIVSFLKTGKAFKDHVYKNIAMLPDIYISLLDYYISHKEEISGTRQWYDFLVISNYMLYGIKLEVLILKKLKKC